MSKICMCAADAVVSHRMVWVERDLKAYLDPFPLPWAGTCLRRSDCSKSHPAWP